MPKRTRIYKEKKQVYDGRLWRPCCEAKECTTRTKRKLCRKHLPRVKNTDPLKRPYNSHADPWKEKLIAVCKNNNITIIAIKAKENNEKYKLDKLQYLKRDDIVIAICADCKNKFERSIRELIGNNRYNCRDCSYKKKMQLQGKQHWTKENIDTYYFKIILIWNCLQLLLKKNTIDNKWTIPEYRWIQKYFGHFLGAIGFFKIPYQDIRERCTGERTKNKKLTEDELKERLKVIYSSEGFIGLTPQNLDKNHRNFFCYHIGNGWGKNCREIDSVENLSQPKNRLGLPSLYCCTLLNIIQERKKWILQKFPRKCSFDELIEYHFNPIVFKYKDLPPHQWFIRNNECWVLYLSDLDKNWKDVQEALDISTNKHKSKDGRFWDSGGEVCVVNFLVDRDIKVRPGGNYPDEFKQKYNVTGTLDYEFYSPMLKEWIPTEVWGKKYTDKNKNLFKGYLPKRKKKEDFWSSYNKNFLGIEVDDSYNNIKLTEIFKPYIGIIESKDKTYEGVEINISEKSEDEIIRRCKKIIDKYGYLPETKILNKEDVGLARKISRYMGGLCNMRIRLNVFNKGEKKVDWDFDKHIIPALLDFKENKKAEHINVPKDYVVSQECENQEIRGMKLGAISPTIGNFQCFLLNGDTKQKIKKLLDIGFIFNKTEYEWNLVLKGLKYFKHEYGNLDVPNSYKLPPTMDSVDLKDFTLGSRVTSIRCSGSYISEGKSHNRLCEKVLKLYKKYNIKYTSPAERKIILENMGFIFNKENSTNLNSNKQIIKRVRERAQRIITFFKENGRLPKNRGSGKGSNRKLNQKELNEKELNQYLKRIREYFRNPPKTKSLKKMYIEIGEIFSKEISPLWRSSREMSKNCK